MRFLPVTSRTLLVELDDLEQTLALFDALRAAGPPQIAEIVPAARTLMVRAAPGHQADGALAGAIAALAPPAGAPRPAPSGDPVEIPMVYDGADLGDVAAHLGLTRAEVIAAHQAATWTVAFCGFAPGFAYMTGDDPRFDLPRRASPRTRIPAGSVALAGRFCGVYPQETPGGWQLLGRTEMPMWDLARDPPALLRPGMRARFVAATPRQSAGRTSAQPDAQPRAHAAQPRPDENGGAPALRVLSSPFPLLFQDRGRPGQTGQGVSASGALDQGAMARANRAVGNRSGQAVLELTLGPVRLQALAPVVLALTGAATARIDGTPIPPGAAFAMDAGDVVTVAAPEAGMRSYLALRGGYRVAPVMGSAATDTLAFVGPAPLAEGAIIGAAAARAAAAVAATALPEPQPALPRADAVVTLPVTLGPRTDWFAPEIVARFLSQDWQVTPHSSRVGIRLQGDRSLTRDDAAELPSEGTETGAIQVPHSGQPVVFLADHPLTGGYPVIATLHPAALDLAGQIPPGARIRFVADGPFRPIIPTRSR